MSSTAYAESPDLTGHHAAAMKTGAYAADTVPHTSLAKRLYQSPFTIPAVIIATGNLALYILLVISDSSVLSATNPMLWLTFGAVFPAAIAVIGASQHSNIQSQHDDVYSDRNDEEAECIGPYMLLKKLGSGGMGEVFLAEHQLMKRQCAIKLIHADQADNDSMRQNFEREARATARLTHWNTIEVYDYGTADDGRFYYVMEYLQGVNLWEYVDRYGPMDPGRVVYILKQLCDALYEADCAGLVHRDIKPSNVFLTERGQSYDVAKLLDFGLVKAITSEPVGVGRVSKQLMGSPSFMCPEQAVGLTPDCRGDLYSLGAVAYYLLTGRPPFVDDNPIILIVAHATTAVPSFEDIGADVPNDLAKIIMKCLSRTACDRYESARELRVALEGCQCQNDWTWQNAEQWWREHKPESQPLEGATGNHLLTAENAPGSTIDFNEPTAVYDAPPDSAFD